MAEPDAAGPRDSSGPNERALTTREDILAAVDREGAALTPEERTMRPTLETLEGGTKSAAAFQPAPWDPTQPATLDPNNRGQALSRIEPAHRPADPEETLAAKAGLADSGAPATPWPAECFEGGALAGFRVADRLARHVAPELFGRSANAPPQESTAKARSQPPEPAPRQRPPFEIDPPARLLTALRQAFPGFKPTDRWWVHVERTLKDAHHRSKPEAHDAFVADFLNWTADDLTRHLEAEGYVKRASVPRGPTVCERLRELHKEDPDFAETAPEPAVAERIGKKGPGSLSKSAYWQSTLKPRRREVRARAQLARAGLRSNAAIPSKAQARSENLDHREAVRSLDDQIDGGH